MISNINTKIIATLGPKTFKKKEIEGLIKAGVKIIRLNASHGTHEEFKKTIKRIRLIEKKLNQNITIILDLQGPKIRLNRFIKELEIKKGETIYIETCKNIDDKKDRVCITYPKLLKEIKPNDSVYIDDGTIELKVDLVEKEKIKFKVKRGGTLKPRKGVNLPSTKISTPALTNQDLKDVKFALNENIDYLALSFVRNKKDVIKLRKVIKKQNKNTSIISKIEKPEALDDIENIIDVSDAILIARGDLGVEIDIQKVPTTQKNIIDLCKKKNTPVIVATQMLESMTKNSKPTRAEVTDVYQAVRDGSDLVMLSAETAVGNYPILTVKTMKKIIRESEQIMSVRFRNIKLKENIDESIAYLSAALTEKVNARFICVFTTSGWTARLVSKMCTKHPIVAFTISNEKCRKINLYKGVTPICLNKNIKNLEELFEITKKTILNNKLAKKGSCVVIVAGQPLGQPGTTNMMKVQKI
jgi:pyruvate kinase